MKRNAGKADGAVQGLVGRLAKATEPTTGESLFNRGLVSSMYRRVISCFGNVAENKFRYGRDVADAST